MTILLLIIPILLGCLYGGISERRAFNNGICKKLGLPWIYFDTDSQGGRGYKSGKYTTWVSWPRIDNDHQI